MQNNKHIIYIGISLFIAFVYFILSKIVDFKNSIYLTYFRSRLIIGVIIIIISIELIFLIPKVHYISMLVSSLGLFLLSFALETQSFFILTFNVELSKTVFILSQFAITFAPVPFMFFVLVHFKKHISAKELFPLWVYIPIEFIYQPLDMIIQVKTYNIAGKQYLYWVYEPRYFWINIFYYISIMWVVIYLVYIVIKARKYTTNPLKIKEQNIFLLGVFLIFIVSPLVFYLNRFITDETLQFFWVTVVGRGVLILGFGIFCIMYIKNIASSTLFQLQPYEQLIITNINDKSIIYIKNFIAIHNESMLEIYPEIATSISELLSEATGIAANVKTINFEDKKFMIWRLEEWAIAIILVTTYSTRVIEINMLKFIEKLLNILVEQGQIDYMQIDPLVNTTFR